MVNNKTDLVKQHICVQTGSRLNLKCISIFLFFGFFLNVLQAQQNDPPEPCLSGSENTCTCTNSIATTLCDPLDLDGFSYVMTSFQHPADGPNNPMCIPNGNGTTAHNPTWFAFIAWCTDLTMVVNFSGCTDMQPGPGTCAGLQAAVFSDCNNIPGSTVPGGCHTGGGCNSANGNRTLNLTGLTIGTRYYFLIDGCCGSSCPNVSIDVLTTGCEATIDPFSAPIGGPTKACVGETVTFTSGLATGANVYDWYVDGVFEDYDRLAPITFTHTFNAVGTYEICVNAWNAPCIPNNDPDAETQCHTIEIVESGAGTPLATPTPVCPNGVVNLSVSGHVDDPYFIQKLVVVNSAGVIVAVINGDMGTYTFDGCEQFTLYSINYSSQLSPAPNITVGQPWSGVNCTGVCCDVESVPFEFAEQGNISFDNPPADISVDCIDDVPPIAPLPWMSVCGGSGTAAGTQMQGSYTACTGGTITRTWTVQDGCGEDFSHSQLITIEPIPQAAFVNPPADMTISCAQLAGLMHPNLDYTNNESGMCGIMGMRSPTTTGTATICAGGTLTDTWTFTDVCSRVLTHVQNITVVPAAVPVFVNPPANVTIACDELATFTPPNLSVTNNDLGACLVTGTSVPSVTGMATVCGGTKTVTWQYQDFCMRNITHTQNVTVTPAAIPAFVNPPANTTINCEELATLTPTPLNYTNNDMGNCLFAGVTNATINNQATVCGGTVTFTWNHTDQCTNNIQHIQTVTVNPIEAPDFINPPQDMTIACHELATLPAPPSLNYTNNGLASCLTSGADAPAISGMATVCGGTITYTWEFTDQCNNMISHTQDIEVTPIEPPAFVNPPGDITIQCHELATLPPAPSLNFTNNGTATCLTSGADVPAVSGMATVCGGTITYTWEFTDQCGQNIEHEQNITVTPIEPPTFVNPPADITILCHELAILPPAPSLNYTNNGTATCLTSGADVPAVSGMATVCGGTITYTWEFTDQCGQNIEHEQNITVTPIEPPAFVNPPADITILCHELATLPVAPPLNYTNNGTLTCLTTGSDNPATSGMATVCGGTITYTWEFTDQCNNNIEHEQNITVTPIEPPAFVNPPGDQTIQCHELATLPTAPPLNYTNNGTLSCLTSGSDDPVTSGMATVCGGTITYTWEFTDQCNNTIQHEQNIMVTPIEPPAFVNPPGDQTIQCHELATLPTAPTLSYTNNGMATCLTSGAATPTESGNATICGGNKIYTWEFTDQCNNMISHVQTLTVTPIEAPEFTNPPGDITIQCHELATLPSAPTLSYTNMGTATCLTEGMVPATESGNATICGGTKTFTWEFTDQCNNTINHMQNVVVTPVEPPQFINPPADIVIPCNDAASYNPLDLSYTNNGMDNCLTTGVVSPTLQGNPPNICGSVSTYMWTFTDQCNNNITHSQNVTVTPITPPVFNNPPANITVNCDAVPSGPMDLTYQNSDTGACSLSGSVPGTVSGGANECGGTIMYTWEFTDQCNNMINHVQSITVNPAPLPVFVNPPADMTVACNQIPTVAPNLEYSNGGVGGCAVNGFAPGVLSGNANECGGTKTITWTYTDPCNNTITHVQNITVTPALPPSFTTLPPNITVTCANVPGVPPPLNYTNNDICPIAGVVSPTQSGSFNACGGSIQYTWNVNTQCGVVLNHVQTVSVLPSAPPQWINPPANITVACTDANPNPTVLNYTNNEFGACAVTGSVQSVVSSNYSSCGGTINKQWSFTDICGRNITHTQTITVLPSNPPVFINPPQDVTVSCGNIPSSIFLNYANNATGVCNIAGTVLSTESGNYGLCGGTMFNSWSYTDPCGRTISYQRQITVLPADDPEFFNAPPDVTLACDEGIPSPLPLSYGNGGSGLCNLFGQITPTVDVNGNVTTYTWTFVHPCNGTVLEHVRNITSPPAPILVLEPDFDSACEGQGYELANINAIDFSGGNTTFTFYWAMPFEPGNEIIDPIIYPTMATEIYVLATNEFGCTDDAIFLIEITPAPNAGTGRNDTICTGTNINLFNFLTGPYDAGGQWRRISGPTLNLSNPSNVTIATAGTYQFQYRILGTAPCIDDVATVNILARPKPPIQVLLKACTSDKTEYQVTVQAINLTVTSNLGTVVVNGDSTVTVFNIPIGDNVFISVVDTLTQCSNSTEITPPNCDCPQIAPPSNPQNQSVCYGQPNPTLSVTVDPLESASWYTAASGGTLVASNTLQFTPTDSDVGSYTYYVEAYLLSDASCLSSSRTPVTLTILELPSASNATLENCDDNVDGFVSFNLLTAIPLVNSSAGITVTFHLSYPDALSGNNPLGNNFTNTIPGVQTIFASVVNSDGCRQTSELRLIVNPQPLVEVSVTGEVCNNQNNGSATLSTSSMGGIYQYRINGTSYSSQTLYSPLQPGNYTAFVRDDKGCIGQKPFTVETGLLLTINGFAQFCNNNGTQTNVNDDVYTISWTIVNNKNNTGTYRVLENGIDIGTHNYNELVSVIRNANGQVYTYVFEDVVTGCTTTVTANPLAPCSTDCEVILTSYLELCDDNGTPTNPSDDTYIISFNADKVNNPSSNTFNVYVNSAFVGNFTYNSNHSITLPADGTSPSIIFRDGLNLFCETMITIGPLVHCSNQCAIEITQLNKVCNNNGTKLDATDDFYTITINAQAINAPGATGQFRVLVDNVEVTAFTYGTGGSFNIPADGLDHTIEIRDFDNAGCTDTGTTGLLISCSTDCQVTIATLLYNCNNNGTASDDSDDYYSVEFLVTAINGAANGRFELRVNNVLIGDYAYGFTHQINLPADGAVNEFVFSDSSDPSCFETRILPAFTSCSGACVLTATVTNITCFDNNTPTNPNDDRFFFDLNVTGVNTGSGYTLLVNNSPGSYGVTRNVGPFPISGGAINSFVVDAGNPACLTAVQVTPPATCSNGCSLVVSNFQKTGCNNNGTNDDNNDDFYSVSFRVTTMFAGATQYTVTYNGNTYGPYMYGQNVVLNNIPSDGIEYTFVINDITAANCVATFKTQDFPCSECAQVITVSINPSILDCNNNVATLTATSSAPGTFHWTGPNNYSQFGLVVQASFPGWYYFTATYPDMCERMDSVQLFTDANLPQAIGGPDKSITCSTKEVTLFGTSNLPDSDARYTWYDASGNVIATGKNVLITVPGTYFLEVEDITNNCKSGRDAVVVADDTQLPSAVIFADPGNILDCVIASIILSGQPQNNVIFNWTFGEFYYGDQNSVTVNQPGTVVLVAVDTITGCNNTSQLIIEDFTDYPIVQVKPVDPITCESNSTVLDASGSPQGPNLIFTWLNSNNQVISGQTGSMLTVTSPGTYYVMLTDTTNGCRNIDTITVTRIGDYPMLDISDDVFLYCGPTQATLSVNVINPVSATAINWSASQGTILGGASGSSVLVEGSGTYVVEVSYLNSGCKTSDSVQVVVNTDVPEAVDAEVRGETCVNEKDGLVSIVNITGGTAPYSVVLNNSNLGQVSTIPSLAPGNYTLRIIDAHGCTKDTTFRIEPGVDVQLDLEPIIELVAGESSSLEVLVNVDLGTISSILWSPNTNLSCDSCLITQVTAVQDGVYTVMVVDTNGCSATASIRLIIKDNVVINVPNIIKGGSFGGNNRFFISANDQVLNIQTLKIYDRWGNLVFANENFKPNNPNDGWDGTFKNKNVVQGVYVYYIEYVTRKGVQKLAGDLTVLEE